MKFTRGNTKAIYFARRYKEDKSIIKEKAKQIYFTVKKYPNDDFEVLLQKTVDDMTFDEEGYYHLVLNPSDTENLKFGDYYYDIKVVIDDYKRTIKKDEFVLTNEVTDKKNEV